MSSTCNITLVDCRAVAGLDQRRNEDRRFGWSVGQREDLPSVPESNERLHGWVTSPSIYLVMAPIDLSAYFSVCCQRTFVFASLCWCFSCGCVAGVRAVFYRWDGATWRDAVRAGGVRGSHHGLRASLHPGCCHLGSLQRVRERRAGRTSGMGRCNWVHKRLIRVLSHYSFHLVRTPAVTVVDRRFVNIITCFWQMLC